AAVLTTSADPAGESDGRRQVEQCEPSVDDDAGECGATVSDRCLQERDGPEGVDARAGADEHRAVSAEAVREKADDATGDEQDTPGVDRHGLPGDGQRRTGGAGRGAEDQD